MSRQHVRQAFAEALDLPADTDIEALELGNQPHWDSVGHMALVAELEDRFGIELETDDIIEQMRLANFHNPLLGVVEDGPQAVVAPSIEYKGTTGRYDSHGAVEQPRAKIDFGDHIEAYVFER